MEYLSFSFQVFAVFLTLLAIAVIIYTILVLFTNDGGKYE